MRAYVTLLCGVVLAAVAGCNDSSQSPESPAETPCREATPDAEIPIAVHPASDRVDLDTPSFSDPTAVTNPLFPIASLHSALLLGTEEGVPLRVETTLLDRTQTINLGDEEIEVLVSQYLSILDGRIAEVALDWYGQADDGSVWYFGEDVFNYENGLVADREGTWITCEDGPAAMIMPASPRTGDVYRPENAYPIVFEEVTVQLVNETVTGPTGSVTGAIVVEELHMDGTTEAKTFAPGYGEFFTGSSGDVEAVALAVPTDALPGPPPNELSGVRESAYSLFDAAHSGDWDAASTTLSSMNAAWTTYQASGVPPMLATQMDDALDALGAAITATDPHAARHAALDVALAGSDLELRYRPRVEIDYIRLDLWARRLQVDTEADDRDGVASDVAIIEWVWDRVAPQEEEEPRRAIEAAISRARTGVNRADRAEVLHAAKEIGRSISRRTREVNE